MIRPALERGAAVVCDRYLDSSLAYQGIARRLGIEEVLQLNLTVVGGLLPDRTFVLQLDPAAAAKRTRRARDRIEREGEEFHAALDAAYWQLGQLYPERIVLLDGSLAPDALAEQIRRSLP